MCDTLCVLGADGTLFAKNSDRPVTEAQVIEAHPRRPAAPPLRTQYLEIPDRGAFATVLARPTWLWGAEHGVNEHGVAIGNEMVNTVDDPRLAAPALLGMDLVRLGLERAASADEALEVMTTLLERHGQGGVGDAVNDVSYWSSFLVADAASAWVLETSGRAWAARPVAHGDAISNRLTLRADWTRGSPASRPGPISTPGATRPRPPASPTAVSPPAGTSYAAGWLHRGPRPRIRRHGRATRWPTCATTARDRGARPGAGRTSSPHPPRSRPTAPG